MLRRDRLNMIVMDVCLERGNGDLRLGQFRPYAVPYLSINEFLVACYMPAVENFINGNKKG